MEANACVREQWELSQLGCSTARTKSIISADGLFHQGSIHGQDREGGDGLAHQPRQMVPQTRRWKREQDALALLVTVEKYVEETIDDIKLNNKVRLACAILRVGSKVPVGR